METAARVGFPIQIDRLRILESTLLHTSYLSTRALAKRCHSRSHARTFGGLRRSHARSFHVQGQLIQLGACLVPRSGLLLLISAKKLFYLNFITVCLGDVPIIVDRTVWNLSKSQIADIKCEVTHARKLPISREKVYDQDCKDLQMPEIRYHSGLIDKGTAQLFVCTW